LGSLVIATAGSNHSQAVEPTVDDRAAERVDRPSVFGMEWDRVDVAVDQ
jgi:hypothetical protein